MQRHYKTNVYMVRICSKRATGADAGVVCVPQPEWRSAGEDLVLRGGSKKYMKQADYDSLEMFVRDMTRSNIVPFMEQHVHIWNEQLAAARLGLAGRLFTASRRYFGGSNRAASGTTYSSAAGAYPVDSDEARLRKMADYAAMLRDWRLAHSTYEFLRRDYGNDKAWKHHAGAQEMAAVSQLMVNAGRVRADAVDAMLDAASYSYLSRCSLPYYALRSVVVAAELMRAGAGAGADGAAHWTMRAAALGAAGG
ncbi:Transport protein particle subunit trs85-2, partial [Neolecta irregularis DAH-3]